MSDTRTYIVPDGQENSTNQMLPWMAMMNGGMGGFGNGMWNNPFMYLVWMWMMRWMNRGEFGDGNNCQNLQSAEIQGQLAGLREQMNTNQNTQLLMDAIKGNSAALGQLATNLNCDFGVLKDCCCNIQNAIAQQEDKLVILLKELSTLQKEVTVMLFRQLITAAAIHRKLLSNKAIKINQQMKDRLIRLLIVQIQQDVQQKEVSCNKEAMNSEVSSMKQRSLDIINSIETHQSIIKGCDEILSQLNPEIVEKQRQEQENKALREEINSLKEMFREFIKTSLKQEQHGNNN